MPRRCSVCVHPDKRAIEKALIDKVPRRAIVATYGVSKSALGRHKEQHLPASLVAAQEGFASLAQADNLLDHMANLEKRARMILARAEAKGDNATALKAVREVRGCLELLARAAGELQAGALPQHQALNLAREMSAVVMEVETDEEILERIRNGWLELFRRYL